MKMPHNEANFGSGALAINKLASGPLILTFVPAEKECECQNRTTSLQMPAYVT